LGGNHFPGVETFRSLNVATGLASIGQAAGECVGRILVELNFEFTWNCRLEIKSTKIR
jgi:hypothetical protein